MNFYNYNRKIAVSYAEKWALSRNPKYYNFDQVGGDCTSFVSQCIYAGCESMNYSSVTYGWYYINGNNKSPSWTGVEFLYNFLINNKGIGPYGKETTINNMEIGDVIQLKFSEDIFSHSMIISKIFHNNWDNIFICSHTSDALNRRLSTYSFNNIRFIHIEGFRK